MHRKTTAVVLAALALAVGSTCALGQVGTAFTYQGLLKNASLNVTSATDMQFSLWTLPVGGVQVGATVTKLAVPVSVGVFTTDVDFGVNPYTSDQALYLQVSIRNPAGAGAYVPLTPRDRLTATPFSLATRGLAVDGAGNVTVGGSVTASSFSGAGAGLTGVNAATALTATTATTATTAATATNALALNGQPDTFYRDAGNLNAGTLPNGRFVGAYTGLLSLTNAGNTFSGAFSGSGAGLTGVDAALLNGQAGTFYRDASNVNSGTLANARTTGTASNTPSTLVLRDASGNFSAGTMTGSLSGNASSATTAATATNALALNGQADTFYRDAGNVNAGTLANARTTGTIANTPGTLVLRDASGDFSAGTITAALNGNASSATTAGSATTAATASNALALNGQADTFYRDASSLNAGTLADARLSASVALRDAANAFGNFTNTFLGNVAVGTATTAERLTVDGRTLLQNGAPITVLPAATWLDEDLRIYSVDAQLSLYSLQSGGGSGTISLKEVDGSGNLTNAWTMARSTAGVLNFTYDIGPIPGSGAAALSLLSTGNALFAGNVGFGAPVPTAKIHVVGESRFQGGIRMGDDGENGNTIRLYRYNGPPGLSNIYLDMGATNDNNAAVIIQRGVNDVYQFFLDGTALKPGGGSWAVLSDENTKNGITPLTGTLDRLLRLRGHSYTYKSEYVAKGLALPGTQIGLVAQEVEAVFPDWVSTRADGLKTVNERSTTALMVEALRDLRAEKDGQIAALRVENEALKARLDRIESMLTRRAAQNPVETSK